jgi:DNA-binding NtrC family response regulator
MERSLALVADQDAAVRAAIREVLEQRKVMTLGAESAGEAIDTLGARQIELLFVDLDAGGTDMRAVLRHSRQLRPAPLAIGLAQNEGAFGAGSPQEAGLFDLMRKPLAGDRLRFTVERALGQLKLLHEMRRLRAELQSRQGFHGLVGRSGAMEHVREQLDRLAPGDLSVWFAGEEGTGKTLAARTLHSGSPRRDGPFVVVDCQSLNAEEWDRQWSATGDGAAGFASRAAGGTLYLDHVTSLSRVRQAQLLDVLGTWSAAPDQAPAGGSSLPRVLAGALEEPGVAVERGLLVDGLGRRLARATVRMPPLRDRVEDVALLARHFVQGICQVNQMPSLALSPAALDALERYSWPSNVRELRNAVEHGVILAAEGAIRPQDLPDRIRESSGRDGGGGGTWYAATRRFRDAKRAVVDSFERSYLSDLLERHGGNVTSASQHAGMLRSALQRLLRKHGLKSAEFRRPRGAARRREKPEPALD